MQRFLVMRGFVAVNAGPEIVGEVPDMDSRVAAVIELMRQSLSQPLSIDTLSKRINLSAPRLRQLFKRETGLSPIGYLKQLRMNEAAQLLRSSFLSIKEISFQIGAGDISHFVREFRKQYGVTPSNFRAHARPRRATLSE